MPCCRHNSAVFTPLSPCFRIAMTCSSLWRVPRILCSPFLRPENYHPIWIEKWGPGHTLRNGNILLRTTRRRLAYLAAVQHLKVIERETLNLLYEKQNGYA